MFVDDLSKRTEIYANSRTTAEEFPVLGTGPGSFGTIYRLYKEAGQQWEAYLHDDWLETRITFGWIGFGVICLMLILVLARWFVPGGGIPMHWDFVLFTWLALAGCLAHAKLDFPFQIYSLQFLFLLLCSMLFCLSRSFPVCFLFKPLVLFLGSTSVKANDQRPETFGLVNGSFL